VFSPPIGRFCPQPLSGFCRCQGVTVNNQPNIVMMSEEWQRELQAVRQRMIEQQKGG
jgi:hypothetical protein